MPNNNPDSHPDSDFEPAVDILDSRTSQMDDLLLQKLESAFHKSTSQIFFNELAKIAAEHDPIDLAHLSSRLPPSARAALYSNLPDLQAKIIFMIHAASGSRSSIFKRIGDSEIVELVERMPPDEAVAFLEELSDRRHRRVMELLDPKKAQRILELQKHGKESAGRIMTNEFFSFPYTVKIGEIAEAIRDNPGIDLTQHVFIYDDEEELIGYVPDRNLIINSKELPVRQVMRPIMHMVGPEASRDEVVDLIERYNIPALPVVNEKRQILGVINFEDAMEALMDINDETIANIAGTVENANEHDPIIKRFFWRAPWLFVTLCAGLVTASFMTHFSANPWFAFVPFFVPLITGMSGNVGIQCSTLLVRSISLGQVTAGSRKNAIIKELMIGLLIGLIFGMCCGLVVYILELFVFNTFSHDPSIYGLIVSVGVFCACMTATSLGATMPFFFARIGVDPAVSSGPIVTAFNDVLSSLTFFLVAKLFYDFFLA